MDSEEEKSGKVEIDNETSDKQRKLTTKTLIVDNDKMNSVNQKIKPKTKMESGKLFLTLFWH